ncbi:MAG: rod shape-determining protein MreC [Clostridia bacterium]|nr:rod shape-determining protein MreC [Clostridia bacterium]
MRFFFRSKQFKIILATVLAFLTIGVVCIILGGKISPHADLFSTISAPFRTAFTRISAGVEDFIANFAEGEEARLQNAELETEIASLREQLVDLEKAKKENEFYKNYLEIKDSHPDFKFAPATLISKDEKDPFKGFTVNAGSVDGIEPRDPVITEKGLVGYISEVGLTTSKVTTVLDPDITLGALDNRTSDSGVLYGSFENAKLGLTGLYNLSRSCNIAVGDFIVTSGEGIFPEGLLIGTVKSIGSEKYNTSIFAAIEPFCDFDSIRDVMIITNFEGQGGLDPNS